MVFSDLKAETAVAHKELVMSRSEIQGNTDLNWNSTAIFLLGHAVQLEIGVDCQEQDGSKTWRVKTETTPTHTRQFECEPERSNILALHSLDFILQSVYTYMADPVVLFNVLIWPRVFAIGQETQRLAIWHKDAKAGASGEVKEDMDCRAYAR